MGLENLEGNTGLQSAIKQVYGLMICQAPCRVNNFRLQKNINDEVMCFMPIQCVLAGEKIVCSHKKLYISVFYGMSLVNMAVSRIIKNRTNTV